MDAGQRRVAVTLNRFRHMRTQAPRGITLLVALILWLAGALEMLAGIEMPYGVGRWCLLLAGALLFLGCLIRGL